MKYEQWRRTLAELQGGRPLFRDQIPESMQALADLVKEKQISLVVEIGTNYGLSTRVFLENAPKVVAIDMTFNPWRKSLEVLPVDASNLTLIERGINGVILQDLWTENDRVLLYFDCHGVGPINYTLQSVAYLPEGSIVAVDDLWYSEDRLSGESAEEFYNAVVINEVDANAPRGIGPQSYASYWEQGSFYGFSEVVPLMEWVNNRNIVLNIAPKFVWWEV